MLNLSLINLNAMLAIALRWYEDIEIMLQKLYTLAKYKINDKNYLIFLLLTYSI